MSSDEIHNLVYKTAILRDEDDDQPPPSFTEEMQKLETVLQQMSNTCYGLECEISKNR